MAKEEAETLVKGAMVGWRRILYKNSRATVNAGEEDRCKFEVVG